jgi:hypothetical protein
MPRNYTGLLTKSRSWHIWWHITTTVHTLDHQGHGVDENLGTRTRALSVESVEVQH